MARALNAGVCGRLLSEESMVYPVVREDTGEPGDRAMGL